MKKIVSALCFLACSQFASASDKDVLRDACGTLKPANKKSACFDALDRLMAPPTPVVTAPPSPAAPKPLKVSIRGLQCEAMEFSELNSMPADELESLYCSYELGEKTSTEVNKKMMDKNEGNPGVQATLLRIHIANLERCMRGSTKASDAIQRKFPGLKADCSKMPQKKQPEDTSDFGKPVQ